MVSHAILFIDRSQNSSRFQRKATSRGDTSESEEEEDDEEAEEDWRFTIEALLALDGTETSDEDASARNRDALLDPLKGVTDLNLGLDALMSAFFKPIGLVTKWLQTTHQPIQHRIMRLLRTTLKNVGRFGGSGEFSEPYNSWRE